MLKKWPATTNELKAAGYEYDNESHCRGCGELIEWWLTPKGAKMPLGIIPPPDLLKNSEEKREPHFIKCPNINEFRR